MKTLSKYKFYNSGKISPVNIPHRTYNGKEEWVWNKTYCYLCGHPVKDQRFCSNCGALLDWDFCKTIPKKMGFWGRVHCYEKWMEDGCYNDDKKTK